MQVNKPRDDEGTFCVHYAGGKIAWYGRRDVGHQAAGYGYVEAAEPSRHRVHHAAATHEEVEQLPVFACRAQAAVRRAQWKKVAIWSRIS
jgi:hypothetical protein